jgi:hypothetical protein
MYGLTARQVAIFGVAAAIAYLAFQALRDTAPMPVLAGGLIPLLGAGGLLALGRRDGLPLDVWLLAALRGMRVPRRQVPAQGPVAAPPAWAPAPAGGGALPMPAVLRLPAQAISVDGQIDLGGHRTAALAAATTVNLGLRTGVEQQALVGAFARWLNSLSSDVQIVVSAQPVDLAGHAERLAQAAALLPHAALADACLDHADFLVALELDREPLGRTVTIAHTTTGTGARGEGEAARLAEQTAAALQALGAHTTVLDVAQVFGVLTSCADPYRWADPHTARATPDQPVTATGRVQP